MILDLYATMVIAAAWLDVAAPLDTLLLLPIAACFALSNELSA